MKIHHTLEMRFSYSELLDIIFNSSYSSDLHTTNRLFSHQGHSAFYHSVSNPPFVYFYRCALNAGKTACEVSEDLCDLALKLGSSDNVTVVIVQFVFGSPLLG